MHKDNQYELSDQATFWVGVVSDTDPVNGLVRVSFAADSDDDDDDAPAVLVSAWIPYITRKSLSDKETFPFDVNEQVVCMMDEFCEQGVVLGATFNNEDLPDGAGADIYRILYKDGSYEMFDRAAGNKTCKYNGKLHNETNDGAIHEMTDKHSIKNTSDSLADIINDMMEYLTEMTFTNGAGTTTPPNNITNLMAIKTRFANLLV